MRGVASSVVALLAVGVVHALPVPVDADGGLSLRIDGLDPLPFVEGRDRRSKANLGAPERDASKPLPLTFCVSNGTDKAVTGTFSAWMNDDWSMDGPKSEKVSLQPGGHKTVVRTAHAGKRVLPALYPVHARFESGGTSLHPVAVFRAKTENRAFAPPRPDLEKDGVVVLDGSVKRRVFVRVGESTRALDDSEKGDPATGAFFRSEKGFWCGDVKRAGYSGHPPHKTGCGGVWSAWVVDIPDAKHCQMRFWVGVPNAKSDGVGIKVYAGEPNGKAELAYSADQTTTGTWMRHEADLSAWAGRRTAIRLWVDPGAGKNTTCDAFGVSVPILVSGDAEAKGPSPASCAETARSRAAKALASGTDEAGGRYRLSLNGETYGAGVALGRMGLADGAIAFTDGRETLVVNGFDCEVDGLKLADRNMSGLVKTAITAEKGTLRVSWSMPGVKRDDSGTPRFTRLSVGRCDSAFVRVYAGMGNVIEHPDRFTMGCHGFSCSTRHVGADYENGLSLVQASDVFPDEVVCDAGKRVFALVTHHDATLSLTPSRRGAFDAAVRFAACSGYRKSPGFDELSRRIVLDDWRGDYALAAHGLPLSRKYGLDAVYLQHNWQRWGYDVRLPEIWPPRGDRAAFDAMCRAARDSGTVIGLHDNYIDLYPDVPGFTYDDVYYTADGLPHEAWYNPGPRLLSYKWRPDAIWGWHSRNMKAMASEAGAGALFIDVFTASAPKDWYDRSGRFHSKSEQADCWSAAFDRARREFGKPDAIMVSEAGHDALIGHVDAGEADHFPARRILSGAKFSDAERVPWHDAVSHGKMVLLGGGLGSRYAGADIKMPGADEELHGYGSKDYLCTTVIGGRGAMCGESFSRKGVGTWWLLGDVLKILARGDFRSLEFGRDIHEQHSAFSSGEAWVNRATNRCWNVRGHVLPPYGLYAKAGECEAGIVRRGNVDARFAKSPSAWFVDARPPCAVSGEKFAAASVTGFVPRGARAGELEMAWTVLDERAGRYVLFIHFVPHSGGSKILFGGAGTTFEDGKDALSRVGFHKAKIAVRVPGNVAPGEYDMRFGLFDIKKGPRTPLHGWDDGTMRLFGGILSMDGEGRLSWRPDEGTPRTRELGINTAHEMVDFGGIKTDGAFRLVSAGNELLLTPMPDSLAFKARIDLGAVGAAGRRLSSVEPVEPWTGSAPPRWRQDGDDVALEVDACAFAYRMKLR